MDNRPHRKVCLAGCALVLLVLVFAGCGASSREVQMTMGGDTATERRLRREVRPWLGTPHRMGGMSRSGIDCSGLVMTVYDDLFGISLPRTARAQMRMGQGIERRRLAPADLVFFRPTRKYYHVGIYLGQGEFVHTSTSNGVMVSRLDDLYWRDCYLTARRLLPADS